MGYAAPAVTGERHMIRIEEASKTFRAPEGGVVTALNKVSLAIRGNEFLTLLGPSGCGKTTLLRAIGGFEDFDSGGLFLDGQSIAGQPPYRRPINTVFQNYALFPHLTVAANVGYGLEVAGVARAEREQRVSAALNMVGLAGMGQRSPRQLSGGQQQRVALARAIINRPKVLLLDEPLSALDRQLRQSMQIELKSLQHELGITFVFVTHDQEEALTMSDRIAVMNQGSIQQLDNPTEIYDRPANRFVAGFIGISNLYAGRIEESAHGRVRVTTNEGLSLVAPSTLPVGQAVDVVIRPEQLALGAGPAEGSNIPAIIEQAVFVGADLHILARMPNGTPIRALHRRSSQADVPALQPGASLTLHCPPHSPHLMPADAIP